ncbi:MAG: hypothetical protein MMC33_001806 [Icmadophila ericetorum]|nr:hypothetical protein [Icmadophila ericetorum]
MASKIPSDVAPKDVARLPPGIKNNERRRIWTPVAKDWAIFEKYGRETNGAYTEVTVSIAPGGQNAAHWHGSYSETFTAEKGQVGIYSKNVGKIMLSPGESKTVMPGEVHYFFNPGEEDVEMKVLLQPAREGFEKGLYILYGLARDGKSSNGGIPNNLMHTAIILASIGRLLGMEEQLVKRYWD